MARVKVDNKLNVVIGTKAQIEGDTTIPENSITVVTDAELKADEIVYSVEKNVKEAIDDLEVTIGDIDDALDLKENKSEKGIANGYASLDSGAKIPSSQLPDSILGQLEYKGTFNPSGGYPASPEKGWFYIAIANATISGKDYKVGDWAVYNGSSWDKVDNTDAVASVNGKLGVVNLYGTEIEVGNGDNTTIEAKLVEIDAMIGDIDSVLDSILGV